VHGVQRSLALTVVLLLAALAAGCGGGDDTPSAQSWADDVCSAISTWRSSITDAAQSVSDGNVTKESVDDAIGEMKDATSKLTDDLQGLGTPDTDAGEQAKEQADTLSNELEDGTQKIEDATKDVSGASEALAAVSTITSTLSTMTSQVTAAFNSLQDIDAAGELQDAFKNADSCQDLTK
jgi:methyl-accepting chemotaxis protein